MDRIEEIKKELEGVCTERWDTTFSATELISIIGALQGEIGWFRAENSELRNIVSNCAAALMTGAFASPNRSVNFMKNIPKEIASTVGALKSRYDAAEAEVERLRESRYGYIKQRDNLQRLHDEERANCKREAAIVGDQWVGLDRALRAAQTALASTGGDHADQ